VFDESDRLLDEAEASGALDVSQLDDLAYYRSMNRDGVYQRKPNAENRFKALRAWKDYQARFCASGSARPRCGEVAERVLGLER